MRLITLPTWDLKCPPAEMEKKGFYSGFQRQARPLPRFEALGDPRTSARRQRSDSSKQCFKHSTVWRRILEDDQNQAIFVNRFTACSVFH